MMPSTSAAGVSTPPDTGTKDSNSPISEHPMASHKRNHDSSDKDEEGRTTPPSKTLKHTMISDKDDGEVFRNPEDTVTESAPHVEKPGTSARATTPEDSRLKDEEMREHIASPKKKRSREVDDESKDVAEGLSEEVGSESVNGSAVDGEKPARLVPQKKRPRDTSTPRSQSPEPAHDAEPTTTEVEAKESTTSSVTVEAPKDTTPTAKPVFGSAQSDKTQTSSLSFASSGFGALSTASSGFASLAGKPSVFGGGAPAASGFGGLASSKPTTVPKPTSQLSFASAGAATSSGFGSATTSSGFGGLSSGGGRFGSGFAAPVGQKLSSFAAAGKPDVVGTEKPAKAFGAPESDAEDGSEGDGSDNDEGSDQETAEAAGEDKKKPKLGKVPVDDGEAGETTLFQFRAKLFAIESNEKGWKERGVGNLKLNVPQSYVEYDDYTGAPIPGTYDPSSREDEDDGPEPVPARLIMRQENTHRVILNTPIIKALKFEEKSTSSSVQVLFTAFEDGKPINILLRMSEANSKIFMSEIGNVQREL